MKQHTKFLGANSVPREALLQDLQKIVTAAHQAYDTVILCMDANETIPEVAPIIATCILKFCGEAGLVDALFYTTWTLLTQILFQIERKPY